MAYQYPKTVRLLSAARHAFRHARHVAANPRQLFDNYVDPEMDPVQQREKAIHEAGHVVGSWHVGCFPLVIKATMEPMDDLAALIPNVWYERMRYSASVKYKEDPKALAFRSDESIFAELVELYAGPLVQMQEFGVSKTRIRQGQFDFWKARELAEFMVVRRNPDFLDHAEQFVKDKVPFDFVREFAGLVNKAIKNSTVNPASPILSVRYNPELNAQVVQILRQAKADATKIVSENQDEIIKTAEALLAERTLDPQQINILLDHSPELQR